MRYPFHGRTVLLVDEATTGAGERIAAFAADEHLAPIVGTGREVMRTSGDAYPFHGRTVLLVDEATTGAGERHCGIRRR